MATSIRSEEELYALWTRFGTTGAGFRLCGGERLIVLSPGRRNLTTGPDFLDAALLIDGDLRIGPVEMHIEEGEWFAHRHHEDPAYADVILHLLAVPPVGQFRLSLPTLTADVLEREGLSPVSYGNVASHESNDALSAELLVQLSWERFLRRAVEICRGESDRPTVERLRRAFVRRLFDALGYGANREPMRRLAEGALAHESLMIGATFEQTAVILLLLSGLDRPVFLEAGHGMISEADVETIAGESGLLSVGGFWNSPGRPANAPERRIWGGAKLLSELYGGNLFRRLFEALTDCPDPMRALTELLTVRIGSRSYVGTQRAMEIVVNAFLPVAVATGIMAGRPEVIRGSCAAYRGAPSLASNRIVRSVERRFLKGRSLHGAFWQQGAIELHQRYLTSDRSGLSFVAERS